MAIGSSGESVFWQDEGDESQHPATRRKIEASLDGECEDVGKRVRVCGGEVDLVA